MRASAADAFTPGAQDPAGTLRRLLGWLTLGYVAFVVYGSLVPLQPVAKALDEAWRSFLGTGWAGEGHLSRTDVAVNVVLDIPLALLARAWLHRAGQAWAWRRATDLAVWLGCALLAVGVEFAQVYFPARSHALSDVVAQWLGAVFGLVLHAWRGDALRHWALGWWQLQQGRPATVWLLRAWLLGLLAAALVPLDLTISPVEIYHKWREGRVYLWPFSDLPSEPAAALWELGSDALLWAPVGVLWCLQGRSLSGVFWRGLGLAALVELAQLFVFSRVSSSSDVLVGGLGVVLGALAVPSRATIALPASPAQAGATSPVPTSPGPWQAAWLAWALVVPLLYWFPFQLDLAPATLASRLQAALTRMPFEVLFYSSEQRAVTEMLRKLLVFLPGGLLWAGWHARRPGTRGSAGAGWLLVAAALALLVEAGQLAMPQKVADLTDAGLGVLGGWMGWLVGRRLWAVSAHAPRHAAPGRDLRRPVSPQTSPYTPLHAPAAGSSSPPGLVEPVFVGLLALGMWLLARLPGVPYNVRELLPGGPAGLLSALALAGVAWCLFCLPLWQLDRWRTRPERALHALWQLPVQGLLAGLLLQAVPGESLDDVVGSPVWGQWPVLEQVLRYAALHAGIALAATGAVWCVAALAGRAGPRPGTWITVWLLAVVLWAVPVHAVVVTWAATDNLTELMRGGGGPISSLALFVGSALVLTASSALAAMLGGGVLRRWPVLAATAGLGGPLGLYLLWLGSEPLLMKYGQVFSAAQFLLSADRGHYADGSQLVLRAALGLVALMGLVAWLQWPRWRQRALSSRPR